MADDVKTHGSFVACRKRYHRRYSRHSNWECFLETARAPQGDPWKTSCPQQRGRGHRVGFTPSSRRRSRTRGSACQGTRARGPRAPSGASENQVG